jgi:ATP-binding cassette, subfamily B, multidrug efflux pump
MATIATQGELVAKKKVSDRSIYRLLWRFLRPYRWQVAGNFGLLVLISAMSLALPYLIQVAVDGPITNGNLEGLRELGVLYVGLIVGVFTLRYIQMYWLHSIGQGALVNLRQTLYEHILKQDLAFFNKTPVGKLVSRLSNDIEALTELMSTSIVMVLSNMMTLIGIIVVMFLLNWRLALIGLAVIPFMLWASFYFRGGVRRISNDFHRIMGEFQAFVNEQFNGMLVVQLFNRERVSAEEYDEVSRDMHNVFTELRDAYTYYALILQALTILGLSLLLWGGGQGVLAQWATLGMLIAALEYLRRSFEPILQLAEQFSQIQTGLSAGERISVILSEEPKVKAPLQPTHIDHFVPSVRFENVTFAYEDDEEPVMRNVSFEMQAGQRVAIVGATGAGKTSLVKLLARYYDVNEGYILVSGVDLRDLSFQQLRQFVSVVPQNPYIFNGTIADNLRLFNPDITLEQMEKACETACAARFIAKLPNVYNEELLPQGANLSEGQRQLLALARALIHSPQSILVLDEATSSIDTETEVDIQEGLRHVLQGRTSLIIAHRLSTVRDADRILVVKRGQIVEDGNHEQLLKLDGLYAQLYKRQFAEN